MYLEITTRCNMHCAHCCGDYTSKGKDMSMKTFRAAMELADEYAMYLSIGGGEPTVHPRFWDMLGLAIVHSTEFGSPWLATNGKRTEDALRLANLAERGIVAVDLSLDKYHSPIDPKVEEVFTHLEQHKQNNVYGQPISSSNLASIRRATQAPIAAGRAKNLPDATRDQCVCEELRVAVNGDIFWCGCEDAPLLGHVSTGFEFPENYNYECYKDA